MESMEACFGTRPRPALRRLVPLLLLRCAAPLAAPKQAAAPSDAERYANRAAPGAMVRPPMAFRARVGDAAHPAAAGRYRLYLSDACPWAHRCAIVLKLKGLERAAATRTGPLLENLRFAPPFDAYRGWPLVGDDRFAFVDELYEHAAPGYRASHGDGRPSFSVPVLFDEATQTIVNTESADIADMLNSRFDDFADRPDVDLAPAALAEAMDAVNAVVYPAINDGVYRCGFARTQEAYDAAHAAHARGMREIDGRLGRSRWLCGDRFTLAAVWKSTSGTPCPEKTSNLSIKSKLADVRLFTTLARYDAIYSIHFKTGFRLAADFPNLHRFARDAMRLLADTVDLDFAKEHHYASHRMLNPAGIVPRGPACDLLGDDADLPPALTLADLSR
ncbi:glutathione dehydrogenase [Aureococcus anophagefferens]|nr:glutathione dehydrogenase [Aureococcus anophagefferens]